MKKYNLTKIFEYIFYLLLILLYLNIPLIEFLFLIPLIIYLKLNKINNYYLFGLKTTLLIIFIAIINYIYFSGYDLKFLTATIFSFLLFFLPFILISAYFSQKKFYYLSIPSLFSIIYLLMGFTIFNNFWINITGFLSNIPSIIKITGSIGTIFIITMINSLSAKIIINIIEDKKNLKKKLQTLIPISITLIIFIIFISISPENLEKEPMSYKNNETIKIAGIQSNIEYGWVERTLKSQEVYNIYEKLTYKAIKEYSPDIIVYPEYAFSHLLQFDFITMEKLNSIAYNNNISLILGAPLLHNTSSSISKRYDSLFIFENNTLRIYNAYEPTTIFDKDVIKEEIYSKYTIQQKEVGLILCYEENIPWLFSREINNNNPGFFIITGSQADIKNNNGLLLTSLNSRIRAAETNRYIFRLETTGISKIIDNNGKIVKQIEPMQQDILYYEIPIIKEKTFYSKNHNAIEIGFTILFSILITLPFLNTYYSKKIKRLKNKKNKIK